MKYILYGATANTIRKFTPYLYELNIQNDVLFGTDSDPRKWNTVVSGYSVKEPAEIKNYPEATIIIIANSIDPIVNLLRSQGINNKVVTFTWFRFPYIVGVQTHEWLLKNKEYIKAHAAEIKSLYNCTDEYTDKILDEIIAQRSQLKTALIEDIQKMAPFHSVHDYFYDKELAPKGDVTLIDGGAYDGDSIQGVYRIFGDRLKRVHAFEPASTNAKAMAENLKKLGIDKITSIHEIGMFEFDGSLFISGNANNGMGFHLTTVKTENTVEVRQISSMKLEIIGDALLKMDIEGCELAALKGAKAFIEQHRPYMAICLYHKMEDILEIPAYIKSICPEYDFYLRAGGHLECYAVPRK